MGGFTTLSYDRGFGPDQLLSLPEAARLADVPLEQLRAHIESGPMAGRIVAEADGLVAAVTRAELAAHFPATYPAPGRVVVPGAIPAPTAAPAELRLELERLREESARLGAELVLASKVERSLQKYADRLEQRLATLRERLATAARPAAPIPVAAANPAGADLTGANQRRATSPRPLEPRSSWWQRLLRRRPPTAARLA